MQSRLLLAAAGWLVLASYGGVARGADVSPGADAEAELAFQRSDLAYRSGDLPTALREMQRAYALSQRADLLYNLARIEEDLGECKTARGHYREYLELVPEGEARAEAQSGEERLRPRCPGAPTEPVIAPPPAAAPPSQPFPGPRAAPAPPSAPQVLMAESPPDHGSTQRWVGWSMIAGGVVAGVGAAYFLDAAIDSRDALQASVDAQLAGGPRYDPALRTEQHRHIRMAQVLGASSAALVVGGAIVTLLAPRASDGRREAGVALQPGLLAATYGQSF